MDIARLQKLSGITGGAWKEVKTTSDPKSQSTDNYNTDTNNKSAADVRDVDGKADINQDVAATMDSASKEHTDTAKGEIENQQHTISVDDNGAPKVDDETSVTSVKPDAVANEGVEDDAEVILEADKVKDEDCDECGPDCDCEKCKAKMDAEEDEEACDKPMAESAGEVNVKKYANAISTFKSLYKMNDQEAQSIVYALTGGSSRSSANAMTKIFPDAQIKSTSELQSYASQLFDKHPELQRELMEKVATKFESEYNSLKDYVTEAKQ